MRSTPPEPGEDMPGATQPAGASRRAPSEPLRWRPLLTVITAIQTVLDRALAAICIVTFVALVAIVTWQVFTREVLNNSAPWTEEAARYTFVVLAIFATAYVFSERGHIAVEILVAKLPARLEKVMGVVIELVVVFFAILVFIMGGARVAENAWAQSISTLPISVGQVFMVLPIAGVAIVFYSLSHLVGIFAGVEKPVPNFDDTKEAV